MNHYIAEMEKERIEKYQKIIQSVGDNHVYFPYPVISQYLVDNKPENIDYIDYVYKMRKNIKFVNYRKNLSNLTKEIKTGNTNEIANSQLQLEDAISDLISEFKDIKIGKCIAHIIPNCLNAFKMFTITSKIVNTSIQLCFEKDLDSYIKKKICDENNRVNVRE